MEKIKISIRSGAIYSVATYLLYRNIIASIIVFIIASSFKFYNKKYYVLIEKKKTRISFYDFLICLMAKCNTSNNFFNNYKEAYEDYIKIYNHNRFSNIIKQSINIEKINADGNSFLIYIKETFKIEEITNFVNSAMISYKMGNDMNKNILLAVTLIKEKIEVEQSIEILIAQKKSEQLIVSIIPFLVIFIFTFMAKGYLEVMYITLIGKIVMTIAGILFVIQKYMCSKIMKIEV